MSSVSPACRKRRLNGTVSRNNRIKRVASCWCLDGHVKEPYEMSMALGARPCNFFFGPPAHLCAVTYMTEMSLIVTLNSKFTTTISIEYSLFSPGWVVTFLDSNRAAFTFLSCFDLLGVMLAFWISVLKIFKSHQNCWCRVIKIDITKRKGCSIFMSYSEDLLNLVQDRLKNMLQKGIAHQVFYGNLYTVQA